MYTYTNKQNITDARRHTGDKTLGDMEEPPWNGQWQMSLEVKTWFMGATLYLFHPRPIR